MFIGGFLAWLLLLLFVKVSREFDLTGILAEMKTLWSTDDLLIDLGVSARRIWIGWEECEYYPVF
jgi:hypothetical protein